MKKLIMMCAVILSLGVMGSCSKDDDGPSSGGSGKGDGTVTVDGKSFKVKYGYVMSDGEGMKQFMFYDTDILKYMGQEEPNIDLSGLDFIFDDYYPEGVVGIFYKINPKKASGYLYEGPLEDESFSYKNGTVNSSCKSFTVRGVDQLENYIGQFEASYNIECKVKDLGTADDYEEYTRGVPVTEVTDPEQIAFLKSLKNKCFKKEK